MLRDPDLSRSYYPEEARKGRLRIYWDNLLWALHNGEVNPYYFVYGLDRLHGGGISDYLPYEVFRTMRDGRNFRSTSGSDYDYICILRDKFVFSQFVSSLGFPTPRSLAICDRDSVTWTDRKGSFPLEDLLEEQFHADTFCKQLAGELGRGVFPLRIGGGRLFVGEEEITLEQLRTRLGKRRYLIQSRVRQHPQMSALHPPSVNTVRLVTFNNGGTVRAFSAAARIGTKGRSVDNWSAGGILVGVDLASGRLREEGIFKPGYGGRVFQHPDTGIRFSGFQIPHFREAVEVAMDLHSRLYGIHSVGWDIGITEGGPTIIEGNDAWDGYVPMSLERNFKSRFMEMYSG